MAIVLFSFSSYVKSFAGHFKDFHLGREYNGMYCALSGTFANFLRLFEGAKLGRHFDYSTV
jgi:hypothetical protein